MLLAEINEVIKASPAIQIQGRITHLQRRAWNVLLANAYHELPNQEIHSISVRALAAKLGFDSHNHEHLQEALRALVDCTVEWNILNKNQKEEWGVAVLLADARIVEGICRYSFAPQLRMKLYNPIMYTKLNLRLQNRFKGQYALILWEVCFDYFDVDRGQGQTPFITLEKFRELMGVDSDEYPLFGELNRNVIKPAINEINDLTDYFVEVEQKRMGRKVAELKFRIFKVKTLPVEESVLPDVENLPGVAVELVGAGIDRAVAIEIADAEWNYIDPDKIPTPGDYPDFFTYVAEKIEMSLDAPNVANRAGYIIEAVRENYQDERVRKARQVRAEELKEQALEDLAEEFRVKRATLIRQAVHAHPELVEHAAARIQSYMIRERLNEHDSVMAVYQKGGMVKAEIDGILAEEFCQDILAPVNAAYEDEKARILADMD